MTYLNPAHNKGTPLPIVFTAGTFFFPAALIPFFWAVDHMSGYQIKDFFKTEANKSCFFLHYHPAMRVVSQQVCPQDGQEDGVCLRFKVPHQAAAGATWVRGGGRRCCDLHRHPREPETSLQPWRSGYLGMGAGGGRTSREPHNP